MPQPSRLLRLSIGLAVTAAAVLSVALSGAPGGVQAGPLAQARLALVPCTSTSTLFAANLTSAQEVPPSGTGQTGTAVMQLLPDGNLATQLTTTIPVGQVILAHIHSPAPPGVNTSVRVNFFLGPQGAFTSPFNVNGFPPPPPDVLNDMRTGQAYVNIHTVAFPGGEIRGQVACLAATVPPTPIVVVIPTATPVPATSVSAATNIRIRTLPPLLPPLLPPPPPPLLLPPPPMAPPMGMGVMCPGGAMGAPGQMGAGGPMGMPGQMSMP